MDIMEIILLMAGGTVFILSFFIPDRKADTANGGALAKDKLAKLVSSEMESIKSQVEDLMERTERSLEKLSNEKIMAVSEYSDTVLGQIHKNHEETVFLYDMLNSKHVSLKGTVAEVDRALKEARGTLGDLEKTVEELAVVKEQSVSASGAWHPAPQAVLQEAGESAPAAAGAEAEDIQEESGLAENSLHDSGEEKQDENGNDRILELYKQGMPAVEIARNLGRGVGEVKLVIDLFRGQQRAVTGEKL